MLKDPVMKKLSFVFALGCLFMVACDKEEVEPELEITDPTKTFLLAGETMKSWRPGEGFITDCADDVARVADNVYQFHADNRFTYEHGEITENSCGSGDLARVFGNWHFNEAEDSLFVLVTGKVKDGETINFDETDQQYIFEAKLQELSEDELVIQQSFGDETMVGHFNAIQ